MACGVYSGFANNRTEFPGRANRSKKSPRASKRTLDLYKILIGYGANSTLAALFCAELLACDPIATIDLLQVIVKARSRTVAACPEFGILAALVQLRHIFLSLSPFYIEKFERDFC
jgi:hypothetical protein